MAIENIEDMKVDIDKLFKMVLLTNDSVTHLSEEMRDFKDEMRDFKDEMKESRKGLDKKWGDLANKMGTLVEDIVLPSTEDAVLHAFGIEIENISIHVKRSRGKGKERKMMEIDIIASSGKTVIFIEVKSSMTEDYVLKFKNNINSLTFELLYPEYKEFKKILIMASLQIDSSLQEDIHSLGMYSMVMKDGIMKINKMD